MERMPQDFGAEPSEKKKLIALRDWRRWVTSPLHLAGTVAVVALLGFLIGYLITTVAFLPAQDVASGLVRVPDVVGSTADEAQAAIQSARLEYGEAAGLDHSLPSGTVVAQEPLAGQVASPGSAVEVTLSLGARQRPVPDVVGLNRGQAELVLARAGYSSDVIWVDADDDVGKVVGIRPAPGTPLEVPGSVRLIVSAGSLTPDVPDLSASSLDEARSTLERMGLRLGDVTERADSLVAPGTVLDQSPQPGSLVDRGAVVAVVVAIAPSPIQPVDSMALPVDTLDAQADTMIGNQTNDNR
jgi:serine/threonine-protein kinase